MAMERSEEMNVKGYKLELFVLDFENQKIEDLISEIERTRYSSVKVMDTLKIYDGSFSDDHPLNKRATVELEYQRLVELAENKEVER